MAFFELQKSHWAIFRGSGGLEGDRAIVNSWERPAINRQLIDN